MYGAVLIILWGLLVAFTFGCLLFAPPAPEPVPPDPFEADVAAFRRQLHDWDRG